MPREGKRERKRNITSEKQNNLASSPSVLQGMKRDLLTSYERRSVQSKREKN